MSDSAEFPVELDPATAAVRDLISASRDLVVRMAKVMEMNTNDMTAVAMLMERGPMGVAELADRLGIRQPSATALADRLERSGRARRVRCADDRRRVILAETPEARASAVEAWLPGILRIDALCRALTPDARQVVRSFLESVTEAVNDSGLPRHTGEATAITGDTGDTADAAEGTGDTAKSTADTANSPGWDTAGGVRSEQTGARISRHPG